MTGMDSRNALTARSPVPDSRSSGSEYPRKPSAIPNTRMSTPSIQFASRGLRNAPVKNTRIMWSIIAKMKIRAAQWWICRINSPPRTSKDRSSAEE